MKQNYLFFLILSLLLINCESNMHSLPEIDGPVSFGFSEAYGPDDVKPRIFLSLKSQKLYDCYNYEFDFDVSLARNFVNVNLKGIEEPIGCPFYPYYPDTIRSSYSMDLNEGLYRVNLTNNGTVSSYSLHINHKFIEVTSIEPRIRNTSKFFTPMYSKFYRYPENTFAVVGYLSKGNRTLYNEFIDSLNAEFEIENFAFPNDGEPPFVTSYDGINDDRFVSLFKYQSLSQYDKIGTYATKYADRNFDSNVWWTFYIYDSNFTFYDWKPN